MSKKTGTPNQKVVMGYRLRMKVHRARKTKAKLDGRTDISANA